MKPTRQAVFRKLDKLYADMEAAYDQSAAMLGHTCRGCPRNCCVSYFQHHTYLEWAYLWQGLNKLPEKTLAGVKQRAQTYVREARAALSQGLTPNLMCPLNEDGLCIAYRHRMMICRMHGVPNVVTKPSGQRLTFPGCWRCQETIEAGADKVPYLDRTHFYHRLAALEQDLLGKKAGKLPKVDQTLAEMIHAGPPRLV